MHIQSPLMSIVKRCPQCNATYNEDLQFCPRDGSAGRGASQALNVAGPDYGSPAARTEGLGEAALPSGRTPVSAQTAGRETPSGTSGAQLEPERRRSRRDSRQLLRVLPRVRTRRDSVRTMYHIGEALIARGQEERACTLLRAIKDDPGQYRRATLVHYNRYCR